MTATDTTTDATAAGWGEGLSREILVLAGVVVLGTIMTVLDLTVVNVAIPTLARDLGASVPAIQWVMTGYMLAFATVIPLTGWAAERFGARRAGIFALLLFSPGIAVFLYGISEAGGHGGFGSPRTSVTVLAGLALIALFFWHAAVLGGSALVDVSLLRRPGFGAAAVVNLLLMVALFGSLILIPLYYQQVRHEGAVTIGLLLAPQGLGAALALPLAGRLTAKLGARGVASAGMALAVLGMLAYTQVGPGTPYLYLSAALLVVRAGVGATVVPSMAAAFQALARAETPRATSALNVIQRLGGAVGTALFAIVLSRQG